MKKLSKFNFKSNKRNSFSLAIVAIFMAFSFQSNAQVAEHKRFANDYNWKVNVQTNFMDTNFDKENPINTENWSMLPYPSKISIERKVINHLALEVGFSMNKIEKDKNVGGHITNEELNTLSVDGTFKYSIGGLFQIPIVDPYIGVGMGYSEINSEDYFTFNYGGGVNIWLADTGLFGDYVYTRDRLVNRLGLTLEAYGKKNLDKGPGSYLQLGAGVFFVF